MLRTISFAAFLAAIACNVSPWLASAEEPAAHWPRFRGPNGSGIGQIDKPPLTWTEDDFAWRVELPATGHSSPVVWGEKLFVTAAVERSGERFVICLDALSGKNLWEKSFAGDASRTHNRNSLATSTPAVDSQRVYSCWAGPREFKVLALDHSGELAWEVDLGRYKSQHGYGASPIVFGDLVIVANEPDGDGALLALDSASGEIRWKVPRHGQQATYSTPCIFQSKQGAPEIIFTNWQHGITAVDPESGTVNWETPVFEEDKSERAIASPFVAGELVVGTCGYVTAQKHLVAVRPGDKSRGEEPQEAWRLERSISHMGTPLYREGRIYQMSEHGIAACLNAETGEVIWQERAGGTFASSPVLVGDYLYCVSTSGEVYVLAAKDDFELLAKNPLGGLSQSTPAIAHNRLYFRTTRHIVAIDGGK